MGIEEEIAKTQQIQQAYYTIVSEYLPDDPDGIQARVNLIRFLEKEIRTKNGFENTADFRQKLSHFLMRRGITLANTLDKLRITLRG